MNHFCPRDFFLLCVWAKMVKKKVLGDLEQSVETLVLVG